MHRSNRQFVIALLLISALQLCMGCNDRDRDSKSSPSATMPVKVSPWRTQKGSQIVPVRDEAADGEMSAAIAKARATANEARIRWSAAPPEDRKRWAIKWAAAVAVKTNSTDGTGEPRIEHVWVQPVNWSAFRVEGVLVSEPTAELACGKSLGELVNFPIEELTDWMHFASDDTGVPHEGGFTVKVLEARFGKP